MKSKSLGFIGGGRITRILLQGFKNADIVFDKIYVYETNDSVINELIATYPNIEATTTDSSKAASADLVFLALHPPVLLDTLQKIKGSVKDNALIVSLAPKITIEKLMSVLPQTSNIARMNPNAGTFVNKGYNPLSFSTSMNKSVITEFIQLFEKMGKVPVVAENQIEAYAVISAMGHTYFWFQLQQLKELALSFGLSETQAKDAIQAMLTGTTETLFNAGLSYEDVTNLVPVKPLAEYENTINEFYKTALSGIFQKIKPQ